MKKLLPATTRLRPVLVLLLFAFGMTEAGAQSEKDNDACRAAFAQYWLSEDAEVANVHLTISSLSKGKRGAPAKKTELEVRIATDRDKLFYETPNLALYRDRKHAITVVHAGRLVMLDRSQTADKTGETAVSNSITVLRQDFIKKCKLIRCSREVLNGEAVEVFETLPPQVNEKSRIVRAIYYCSPKKKQVIKQILYYNKDSPTQQQEIVLHSQKYSNQGSVAGSAWSKVFTGSGKLNPALAGYTFHDNR